MKTCKKCKETKPVLEFQSFFYKKRTYTRLTCKTCYSRNNYNNDKRKRYQELVSGVPDVSKKRKEYYKKNRERILEQRRKRYKNAQFSKKTESAIVDADLKELIGE